MRMWSPVSSFAVLAFAVLITLCGGAEAQVLPVRAGEHEGFSRLVIPIEEDREWVLEGDGDTRRITLDPGVEGFDLSGSFDLIPRTRIVDLEQQGGELAIRLGCDCVINAFRYQGRYLVVDVSDEESSAARPSEASEASGSAEEVDEDRRPERAVTTSALPDLARLLSRGGRHSLASPATPESPQPARPADRPMLEEAARIMAEQLARAAAAGLLDAAPDRPLHTADPLPVDPRTDAARQPPPEPDAAGRETSSATRTAPPHPPSVQDAEEPAPGQPLNAAEQPEASHAPVRVGRNPAILARTAFDIALRPTPRPVVEQPRISCDGDSPGIANWSVPGGVQAQLGRLRLALYDERDRLRRDAVLDLARHYIFHGFGAEARFWLSQLEEPPPDLVALGDLVDGTGMERFPPVGDEAVCSDEELLLRYLGGAVEGPLTRVQADRLQRAFAALPAPLRARFGPSLVRRLAQDGRRETALNVRELLRHSPFFEEGELLALDLDLGLGPPAEDTREALNEALRDDGATPAGTMARALAFERRGNSTPDPARLTAAEALLRETPPGPDSDRLWREIAVTHAALGQIDAAVRMLDAGRDRDDATWQAAVTDLLENRMEAEDIPGLLALSHFFGPDWTASGSESGRVRAAAAEQLRRAGLEEGAAALETHGPGLILPERETRAVQEMTARTAWSAGDWNTVADIATGAHAEVARRMAARPPDGRTDPTQNTEEPMPGPFDLDAVSANIEDSRALRETISALLSTRLETGPHAAELRQ